MLCAHSNMKLNVMCSSYLLQNPLVNGSTLQLWANAVAVLILVCDSVMQCDLCYLGLAVQEVLQSQWCVKLWCTHVWNLESGTQAIWRQNQPSGEVKFEVDILYCLVIIHNQHSCRHSEWLNQVTDFLLLLLVAQGHCKKIMIQCWWDWFVILIDNIWHAFNVCWYECS